MTTLKFKTNIKCMGCVSTVTPFLEKLSGIEKWEVDLHNADRILTVESTDVSTAEVESAIREAGYNIEVLSAQS